MNNIRDLVNYENDLYFYCRPHNVSKFHSKSVEHITKVYSLEQTYLKMKVIPIEMILFNLIL